MILQAIVTMIIAVIAVHLGLPQAICKVVSNIVDCYKCSSFWLTLLVILYSTMNIAAAVVLAVVMAYLSHYVALLLANFQRLYDALWQKLNRQKP